MADFAQNNPHSFSHQLAQEQAAKHRLLADLRAAHERFHALEEELAETKDRLLVALARVEQQRRRADAAEKAKTTPGPEPEGTRPKDEKFQRAKILLSKKLHPNNFIGANPVETRMREKVFKEIWPEIELISKDSQ
jgi:hypothetical protein